MIPETMKAIVVTAPHKLEIMNLPTPVPSEGEILVRLENCLICTWEQRVYSGDDVALPFVPGHEVSGIVAAVPEHTMTHIKVGMKCVVKTFDSCGQCEYCVRGLDNQCVGASKKRFYDGIPGSGGMAQYIAIGADRVYALPDDNDVDLELAAFAEPLACCLHSMERAEVSFGEDVVIVGGGIMGLLHVQLTKLSGARAILVEPDKTRRDVALAIGAHEVIDPISEDVFAEINRLTGNRGAHAIIFTVNHMQLASDYIGALAKCGRMVYYGSFRPKGEVPFDPNHIHYSEKVLTGAYSPTVKSFWQAAQMLGHELIDVKPFLSECYDMTDADKAFERAGSMETFRVLIRLNA